ncbi:antibiotic biosynthesis monooxygenase [Halosegnis rubeus]|jgi:quinol monooxygenase YgiN|uniref:Antibiotic biosynthesis monooxygenase n=1 Tax=Halosegnis rubeus TaxID=2212850 RepID=A0A5N5UB92_9EURY|nr:putative quinol monooxygenase [Halosegnis rubeus]KAB7515837.1 antibiotic biosynthesis monooxygenase [Halosegnis rubeus]KAB7516949.1 antibiotic biosynthesis monooxygenase [Halosegnis rubeus]KAB7519923.1 antibiotic biosynthesis monooxygenase [Halosegnis rubeus]
MIVQHATIPLSPDAREDGLDALRELGEQSRAESGVVEYRVTVDAEDDTLVHIIERYEDESALGAHSESDHFAAFQEALPTFLGGDPEIVRFDVAETTQVM